MQRKGYILVDHRASPGLPPDIAIACGYHPDQVGEGKILEANTLTCSHCKGVQIMNPLRTRERGHCFKCNHYICDTCWAQSRLPDYSHTPYEKKAEDIINAVVKGHTLGSRTILRP